MLARSDRRRPLGTTDPERAGREAGSVSLAAGWYGKVRMPSAGRAIAGGGTGPAFFFFFQAEDGIRDKLVTGVQTCALPISGQPGRPPRRAAGRGLGYAWVS